ncbi:hypothetical protein EDM35_16035 [Staphylococcus aureus]|nr:hypothetical protein EDM47_16035 [Staphylococcus aureus]RNB22163.1 hypothetical protein EDM35_16035 [Staphylococcus aureus]
MPPPSGYTDDGEPMYQLEDIAKHFGITFEEAEQTLNFSKPSTITKTWSNSMGNITPSLSRPSF